LRHFQLYWSQLTTRTALPAGAIQEGYAPSTGDVNSDSEIGLPEVIYPAEGRGDQVINEKIWTL
jgi:hypothetical protein